MAHYRIEGCQTSALGLQLLGVELDVFFHLLEAVFAEGLDAFAALGGRPEVTVHLNVMIMQNTVVLNYQLSVVCVYSNTLSRACMADLQLDTLFSLLEFRIWSSGLSDTLLSNLDWALLLFTQTTKSPGLGVLD
jgi:hypothetical protein